MNFLNKIITLIVLILFSFYFIFLLILMIGELSNLEKFSKGVFILHTIQIVIVSLIIFFTAKKIRKSGE
jgi:hypothetical protein